MYWGKPDGSIDFCEENYKESVYIAEYWNTISAFVYFIIGYVWIFSRYKKVAMSFMFLSIGTAIWHGTLRYWGQWMDEVGMLILSFYLIQCVHPSLNIKWLGVLISIYFLFQELFFIFGGLFVVLQIYIWLCARYMSIYSNYDWYFYNLILLLSGMFWLKDTFSCDVNSVNYHAIWHMTTALLGHFGMRIVDRFHYVQKMISAQ